LQQQQQQQRRRRPAQAHSLRSADVTAAASTCTQRGKSCQHAQCSCASAAAGWLPYRPTRTGATQLAIITDQGRLTRQLGHAPTPTRTYLCCAAPEALLVPRLGHKVAEKVEKQVQDQQVGHSCRQISGAGTDAGQAGRRPVESEQTRGGGCCMCRDRRGAGRKTPS
jgi:hypothetical protein